jgi:hypothetical protein
LTADWAEATHAAAPDADGMIWMARRCTDRPAMVLFGDRIAAGDLSVTSPSMPLWYGRGLELVEEAAMRVGIALLV